MSSNERSQFWDTAAALGDGTDTYAAVQWRDMARSLWTPDSYTSAGVLALGNELEVSGSASPLSVAAGAAVVQGIYYQNTTPLSVVIPTPTAGTTKHRIVLSARWGTTQAARVALSSSADGVNSYPALKQQDNGQWDISLAGVTIDTDGVITLEDQREFCQFAFPFAAHRRGGSSSAWATYGTTNYKPGEMKIQTGTALMDFDGESSSDPVTVAFPSAYASGATPLVFVTPLIGAFSNGARIKAGCYEIATASFVLRGYRTDGSSVTGQVPAMWLALGRR